MEVAEKKFVKIIIFLCINASFTILPGQKGARPHALQPILSHIFIISGSLEKCPLAFSCNQR